MLYISHCFFFFFLTVQYISLQCRVFNCFFPAIRLVLSFFVFFFPLLLFYSFMYPIVVFILPSFHLVCSTPLTKTSHLSCLMNLTIYPQNITTVFYSYIFKTQVMYSLGDPLVSVPSNFDPCDIHYASLYQHGYSTCYLFIPVSACVHLSAFYFSNISPLLNFNVEHLSCCPHIRSLCHLQFSSMDSFGKCISAILMQKVCLEKMVNAAFLVNETYKLFREQDFSPVIFCEFPMNH